MSHSFYDHDLTLPLRFRGCRRACRAEHGRYTECNWPVANGRRVGRRVGIKKLVVGVGDDGGETGGCFLGYQVLGPDLVRSGGERVGAMVEHSLGE